MPPLVEQSLEYFLVDLLKKCDEVARDHGINKLTPPVLKKALNSLDSYDFLKDALDDVENLSTPIPSKTKIAAPRQTKRARPEGEVPEEKDKQKKGRKKPKVQEEEDEVISIDADE